MLWLAVEHFGVVSDVILDETRDEVVAMVIALQHQRHSA